MKKEKTKKQIPDTSKLRSGMVVKGYKEMCSLVGVEPKNGRRRVLQEEDWTRYFEWEDLGRNHLRRITCVKDYPDLTPPPPNAVYVKLLEVILVNKLIHEDESEIELTWGDLYEYLGMVNKKFKEHKRDRTYDHINDNIRSINRFLYDDWGNRARGGLKRKLRTALDSMQRRQLIIWSEVLYDVVESIENSEWNGKSQLVTFDIHEESGSREREIKTEAHRWVLQELFKEDDEKDIIAKGKYREYINEVNRYLYEKYRIKYFYTKVRISFSPLAVKMGLRATENNLIKVAAEYDLEVKMDELSEMLIKMLGQEAVSKRANAEEKMKGYYIGDDEDGLPEYDNKVYATSLPCLVSDEFIIEQDLFSRYFIDKHITEEELKEKYGNNDTDFDIDSI